jgi:phosphate transport system protein
MTLMWNGRPSFQRALCELQEDVLGLGALVEQAIERAIAALVQFDRTEARQIIDADEHINQERLRIEQKAIELIATQQPMARDLRTIVAALAIVTELERIGDYAEGIAKVVLLHRGPPLPGPLADLGAMAEEARSMLRRSLVAFVQADASAASAIAAEDDTVDDLHERVYRELLGIMLSDPNTVDRATWLLWVAHNLERAADRVTNICERVVYEATGRVEQMNISKY